jgi:hypothetical protein
MEYIRILGGNLAGSVRKFHLSQDDWIKIALVATAVLVLVMVFTRITKK